jgi:hypothetical protein
MTEQGMGRSAQIGLTILVVIITVTALGEAALAVMNILAGKLSGGQIVRWFLTAWLFWKVWDGAAWSRWLLAVLYLFTGVVAIILGMNYAAGERSEELVVLILGMGSVYLLFGIGMASPWMSAYQAEHRYRNGL